MLETPGFAFPIITGKPLVEDEAAPVEAVRGMLSYLEPIADAGEAVDQADLRTLLIDAAGLRCS